MSMLANPKYRQKWSSDPRNTNWSNDSSKFGQRMLERMGWEHGKGLGVNEDGNTSHVKVSKKDDTFGLGANYKTDENWIAHQDDFNSLLANLNDNHGTTEEPKIVSTSLEERSKLSKKRVHYMKFTRGKDLSVYSRTDLACIMGTKTGESKPQSNSPQRPSETESSDSDSANSSTDHGIVTVTSSQSLQEYFAQKMAALKEKQNATLDPLTGGEFATEVNMAAMASDSDDCIWIGKKDEKKKRVKKSKNNKIANNTVDHGREDLKNIDEVVRKSKKKKRAKEEKNDDTKRDELERRDRKKKRKLNREEGRVLDNENIIDEIASKKKKKIKQIDEQNSSDCDESHQKESGLIIVEKSKKKKNKNLDTAHVLDRTQLNSDEIKIKKSKKKKSKREKR
ncbi:PIN2/TERF1-interacting telomerase inhibitor 1-like [Saccoglossus kowalevskii]|uniref:PIN2/TERF1-interacting telomerase inhibitor 1-like n=1 Tax=Saccoglossus kowalevskii TaxID=10224 RepID=A0ABM0LVJ9_SACKO|nr:PREDICTED: PIN2/TERF1-interacting telomerase inhibitor 1-like [Saccoglossus kowalevskii]